MKNNLVLLLFFTASCSNHTVDIQKVYTDNEAKHTVTAGIWGTVAFQEGNCMPMVGGTSTCKTYPVKRTVRIFPYTLPAGANAVANHAGFYSGFNAAMLKEVSSDKNGFYQADLPPGKYSVVVVENDQLYSTITDGQGAINPVEVGTTPQKMDLMINYKATF